MPESEAKPTSFRPSATAREILDRAESELGQKRSAVIESALRMWSRVQWPEPEKKSRKKSGQTA